MLKTIKNMTLKNKLEYIWEYYKFHILGVAILIYILVSILNHFVFNPPPKTYVSIAILEKAIQSDEIDDLTTILNDNLIHKDENLICNVLNYYQSNDIQFTTAMQTAFYANLQGKNLDIIITTADAYKSFSVDGMFAELDTYLTNEELLQLPNNFLYDEKTKKPIGIYIDKSTTLDSVNFDYSNMVIGIVINSQRPESTFETLKLLLNSI